MPVRGMPIVDPEVSGRAWRALAALQDVAFVGVDAGLVVQWAVGDFGRLGRTPDSMIGMQSLDMVDATELDWITADLAETTVDRGRGEVMHRTGALQTRLLDESGQAVVTSVWAWRDDAGYVVLLRWDDLSAARDAALVRLADDGPLEDRLAAILGLLGGPQRRGGIVTSAWLGTPYSQAEPGLAEGLVSQAVIDAVADQASPSDLSVLPADVQTLASHAGFRSVHVFPIASGRDSPPLAHLVVWSERTAIARPAEFDERLGHTLRFALVALRHEQVVRSLQRAATTDPLTNLLNRRGLTDYLAALDDHRIRAICLDIDHFKSVNDRAGHEAGDRVLRAVGVELELAAARWGGAACRLGGDEFCLMVDAATGADEVESELHSGFRDRVSPLVGQRIDASIGRSRDGCASEGWVLVGEADRAAMSSKRSMARTPRVRRTDSR